MAMEAHADSQFAPISKERFKAAIAPLAGTVCVVTTDGPGGKAGFTASSVCGVSDDPPTLLVCINRQSSVHNAFVSNQLFCVNVLAASHQSLSRAFAGKTSTDARFAIGDWTASETPLPVLPTAVVSLECEVVRSMDIATHKIIFGRPFAIHGEAGDPCLIYFRRQYHLLGIAS
jgi:flavin reductase